MRDWIRNRLDEWEGRRERRDEQFAAIVSRNVEALSDRRTLKIYILVLGSINAFLWLSVLLFPRDVAKGWELATDVNDRVGAFMIAIIFVLGMWLTYSLFRLKYHDLENPNFEDEIFASQSYSDHSVKRWRIWLLSVIGGAVNLLVLLITEGYLVMGS